MSDIKQRNDSEKHLFDTSDKLWKKGKEEYLYHYTSWQVAKEHILSGDQSIRFGFMSEMNDPLEFTGVSPNLYGDSKGDRDLPLRIWGAIKLVTREKVQLFCTTEDICSKSCASVIRTSKGLQNVTQILERAKRGFGHAPMWHHYAEQHQGVCLIFNKKILQTEIGKALESQGIVLQGSISYTEERDEGIDFNKHFKMEDVADFDGDQLEGCVKKIVRLDGYQHLFNKNIDWSYEKEFRWAFISDNQENIFVPVKNALAGIVLGCDFDSSLHADAKCLAQQNNIPIERVFWNNGSIAPPWPPEAFEKGGRLESWENGAKLRRESRKNND